MKQLPLKITHFFASRKQILSIAILGGVVILIFIVSIISIALERSTSVNTFPTNGTFQLYNPLRRISEGMIPGRDFPVFHGVGVPWIHFPIFKLFGGNLFAAELSKWLVSPLAFLISTLLICYAYFRKIQPTIVATALFIIMSVSFLDIINPGGSLRGLRGTLPVIVAGAMVWRTKSCLTLRNIRIPTNELIAAALIGLAFVCGTEHGIASGIAFLCTVALSRLYNKRRVTITIIEVITYGAVAALTALCLILALTAGNLESALKYALIDIPQDQGWYFGAPPNPYLTWGNLLPSLLNLALLPILTIITLGIVITCLSLRQHHARIVKIGIFFILYGGILLVGTISGYYIPHVQLIPLARGLGVVLIIYATSLVLSYLAESKFNPQRATILLCMYVLFGWQIVFQLSKIDYAQAATSLTTSWQLRKDNDYHALSPQWRERRDAFMPLVASGETIWSTYAGVYESANNQLGAAPAGEDYIIHALGYDRRDNYLDQFIKTKPRYVTTLIPHFFYYEEWLWSTSGEFYGHLLSNYEIIASNESHYLWQRRLKPFNSDYAHEVKATLHGNESVYTLPTNNSSRPRIYRLHISYRATSPTLFKNNARYFITVNDISSLRHPISLPPYKTDTTLIIAVMPGDKQPHISTDISSLTPGARLQIRKVLYEEIHTSKNNTLPFIDNKCSISGYDDCTNAATMTYP